MRKVCRTTQGDSPCCVAAQRGLLNRPFIFTDTRGNQRCGECAVVASRSKKHAGQPVFQFRFHKNGECGIGPRGCAALAQMGGAGLPAPTTGLLGGQVLPQLGF